MTTRPITLRNITLPEIGFPAEPQPELPAAIFAARLATVRARMMERGLDALVVYGDREHFANLAWLTNYDPRFEESILVILPEGVPVLFVGNEGMTYSNIARLPVERRLYQTFSLLGQPREKVQPLPQLLRETGLEDCARVGTAGWKYFSTAEFDDADEVLDLPDFIASSLRKAIRPGGRVTNETAIFMDAETGLRNLNEPEQLAAFEWISCMNSASLLAGIRAVRPGMTEYEAFSNIPCIGIPFCCSPVCAAGENLRAYGLPSPAGRVIQPGDPIFMTFSYLGANTCRFGWVAHGPDELPAPVADYVERAAMPYFASLAAWYETLRIDATGNELHHAVADRLLPLGFTLGLNIGHQIAADEWTHSMVADGSTQRVRSGMYWQSDFFPSLPTDHIGGFAEDGMAIADEKLRAELAARYPAMWDRVQRRRAFMRDELGIHLADEVLPFSNICGALMPFFLSPALSLTYQ